MSVPADLKDLFDELRLSSSGDLGSGIWRVTRDEDGLDVVVKMWF